MEVWDAYDRNLKKFSGMTLIRGNEPQIPKGVYHLVCDIIVKHRDGSYLLMQRDPVKSYGGMWEITAGGSALMGETPEECACRELMEETGVTAGELKKLCTFFNDATHSVYVAFLCETDCPKDSIVLQEGETCAYKWMSPEELSKADRNELLVKRVLTYILGKIPDEPFVFREERLSAEEYTDFLKRTDLGSQYPKERFQERIERLVDTVTISLTARDEAGKLAGVLFGLTDYCYWLYITDLGVDRACERQGLGSMLMRTAHEIAGGEKDIAIYLIANENAVPFYEKLGMKKADDVMQYNHIEWTEFTVE